MRKIVRCSTCKLNQYMTTSGDCRKCAAPLVAPPPPPVPPPQPTIEYTETDTKCFGMRLRILRTLAGLQQQQLALLLDVKMSAVCRWENTLTSPYRATLMKAADVFQYPIEALTSWDALSLQIYWYFRLLPDEQKRIILEMIRLQAKRTPNLTI